jgi:hypothetical protein
VVQTVCDPRQPPWSKFRSLLFWDVKQRRLVVCYRRFGITYRSHFKGQAAQENCLNFLTVEDGADRLSRNVGN